VVDGVGRGIHPDPDNASSRTDGEGGPVTQFLSNPWFWFSVVVVAVIINIVYKKFFAGKGKLV
jgi:hypothetical protein